MKVRPAKPATAVWFAGAPAIIGTLGVLLAAKRKGLIPVIEPSLASLLEKNFWISPRLVERVLGDAGEGGNG